LDRNFILAAALLAFAPGARAHDIPDEVRVQAFVKPEGQALKLLVRMPLKAMRDVDVPQRQGGFLDFTRVDSSLRDAVALWLAGEIELYEDDARLGKPKLVDARVSLESDRSFAAYESALAHFKEPRLGNDTELYWNQGLLDVLLAYPVRSERSAFLIRPRLERLGIKVNIVLRFLPPGGEARAFDLHGDPPSCASIRAGTRRRCASCTRASSTSCRAPTTFSSCSAWLSRSGASGRSRPSSPPSPSRTPSPSS